MGYIFISYSHKDKDYVHKLQEVLLKEGFEIWTDDHIEYGTEWPKVIQESLDNCDIFIVVMSKNSYESDMVQNEVARAREKKKPTFSLLLEGENWLIFQAKQYVDVKNEELPPDHFYAQLERHTERDKVTERDDVIDPPTKHITNEWPVYQNDKYHFLLKYPPDEETIIDNDHIRMSFPIITGINLQEKSLTISASQGESPNYFQTLGIPVEKKKIRIGKITFLREIGREG
jgi:hypothetical protein